jgi:DNA-binding transcriptional regulator PaaX
MGRPIDHESMRQQKLRGEVPPRGEHFLSEVKRQVTARDFEFLQTVATLNGAQDWPVSLATIANAYGVKKQAIHQRVTRLRRRGWLEWNDEHSRKSAGLRLTHNGKLLVETGLGAWLTE